MCAAFACISAAVPVSAGANPISRSATNSWGLDRIDQAQLPLDGRIETRTDGSGVTVYVIGSGIRADHAQFGGRVTAGYSAIGDGRNTDDCFGTGTYLAGVVGGADYGVAPAAQLVAVRVLDCRGSGSIAGIIAGLNWATVNHEPGNPAVAVIGSYYGYSSALNDRVAALVNDNVTVVAPAGDGAYNACNYSPGSAASAITVAATRPNDSRISISNVGSCVDIFAPGEAIKSAWFSNANATEERNGTTPAAGFVAGVAAVFLSEFPTATPSEVGSSLVGAASPGLVTDAGGSPNLLLSTQVLGEPPVATGAPELSGSAVVGLNVDTSVGRWAAFPVPNYAYQWQVSPNGSVGWSDLEGNTSPSLITPESTVGQYLRAKVVATNIAGATASMSAPSSQVLMRPSDLAAPTVAGTSRPGETLRATSGDWAGFPTPTLSYRWQRTEAEGAWEDIAGSGASGPTYAVSQGDQGYLLRMKVTANNSAGVRTSTSLPSDRVPKPPFNISDPSIYGSARVSEPITAVTGSWGGYPIPTLSYQWQTSSDGSAGWANISGAEAYRYTPTGGDRGRYLRVIVSARNDAGSAFRATGATAAIIGDANPAPIDPAPVDPTPIEPAPTDPCLLTAPAPAGPLGISVNSGATYTNTARVVVSVIWSGCSAGVSLSNDGGFGSAQERPVSRSIDWDLSSSGTERLPKTVYARFRKAGQTLADGRTTFTDDIILDQTSPVIASAGIVSAAGARSAAKMHTYRIKIRASDATSGVASAQFATDNLKKKLSKAQKYLPTLTFKATSRPMWVRATDRAGNTSKWVRLK